MDREAFVEDKRANLLRWVRQRVAEALCSVTVVEKATLDRYGDENALLDALFGTCELAEDRRTELLESIQVKSLDGGFVNLAFQVSSDQANNTNGVFVKVALPYPIIFKKQGLRCNVSRSKHEFLCLERLNAICPGTTAKPIICGSDELCQDGSRYLLIEYLPPRFEKYSFQFRRGNVDPRPARTLGFIVAKMHVEAPVRFHGREGIFDLDAHDFLARFHYEKFLGDLQFYCSTKDFSTPEAQSHFIVPVSPITAQRHANAMIQRRSELTRAFSRQWKNFTSPPATTATLAHLDLHIANILVSSDDSWYQEGAIVDDDNENADNVRLVDMEFSNWGPAGADLGLYFASIAFYTFVHSESETAEEKSGTILRALDETWRVYCDTYHRFARNQGRSDASIFASLYAISHEAIGWAGIWLFRLTQPRAFPFTIKEFYFALPNGYGESLKSRELLEVFRFAANNFAIDAILMGFGDEAEDRQKRVALQTHLTLEFSNEQLARFRVKLLQARDNLRPQLQEVS